MKISLAAVFLIAFVLSCSASDTSGSFKCGGPKEQIVSGSAESLKRLKQFSFAESESGNESTPSSFKWFMSYVNNAPVLHIDGVSYEGSFSDSTNKWNLKLSGGSSQTVGTLYSFDYTVETAIDESHCGTIGFKFEVLHNGTSESFDYKLPIL